MAWKNYILTLVVVVLGSSSLARGDMPTTQSASTTQSATTTRPANSVAPRSSGQSSADLTSLSIEDLMNVQVTSVAKEPQKISEAPASVTVIGQDDIERSGMGSIPELLRLVPGMDVAQIDSNEWAISARGMNSALADDLLVLMDGRSVYTPAFGGVNWSTVSYPLADLDRIEVIRGPGSTLWGSNAVNGVVNIISKSAKDTQGLLVDTRGGTQQDGGVIRYGGQVDANTYYRVYTQYQYNGEGQSPTGDATHDEWQGLQSGFRIDRYATLEDTLTLQGDVYEQNAAEVTIPFPITVARPVYNNGGNLLGRWTHTESDQADTNVQFYYDRQDQVNAPAGYNQDTFDASAQNRFPIGQIQEFTWGMGAREHLIQLTSPSYVTVSPSYLNEYILNGFAQDQVTIVPDRLQWDLGSKLEYNNLTNTEVQPSTRLLWTPDARNSIWAAFSRSVRIPSFYQETNLGLGPIQVGTEHPDAESTLSTELGYKLQPSKDVTLDVTGFYNDYRGLIVTVPNLLNPGAVQYGNAVAAQTYGGELSANWQATPSWRLGASYSLLLAHAQNEQRELADQFVPAYEAQEFANSSPKNQFQLHSYWDVLKNLQFNTSLYYVDTLGQVSQPGGLQYVPSYFRLDLNVAWKITPNITAMAGVQNLLQDSHFEYGSIDSVALPTEVPRTVFAELKMSF